MRRDSRARSAYSMKSTARSDQKYRPSRTWEIGDLVRIKCANEGQATGWILDKHSAHEATVLCKNGEKRRGEVTGRGDTNAWSPNDYGFNEGVRFALRNEYARTHHS